MSDEKQGNRPFKHLCDRFKNYITEDPQNRAKNITSTEDFEIRINDILNNAIAVLNTTDNDINSLRQALDGELTSTSYQHLLAARTTAHTNYESLHRLYEDLINEEKLINRIETKAYRRATLYRTITTALIAGVILSTYWIAAANNIQMPLQGFGKAQQVIQPPPKAG